jgi:hypothetical protein
MSLLQVDGKIGNQEIAATELYHSPASSAPYVSGVSAIPDNIQSRPVLPLQVRNFEKAIVFMIGSAAELSSETLAVCQKHQEIKVYIFLIHQRGNHRASKKEHPYVISYSQLCRHEDLLVALNSFGPPLPPSFLCRSWYEEGIMSARICTSSYYNRRGRCL